MEWNDYCIICKEKCCVRGKDYLVRFDDGVTTNKCPYYKYGMCEVYKQRPVDCRVYPILAGKRKGKRVISIDFTCPASNAYILNLKEKDGWARKHLSMVKRILKTDKKYRDYLYKLSRKFYLVPIV